MGLGQYFYVFLICLGYRYESRTTFLTLNVSLLDGVARQAVVRVDHDLAAVGLLAVLTMAVLTQPARMEPTAGRGKTMDQIQPYKRGM